MDSLYCRHTTKSAGRNLASPVSGLEPVRNRSGTVRDPFFRVKPRLQWASKLLQKWLTCSKKSLVSDRPSVYDTDVKRRKDTLMTTFSITTVDRSEWNNESDPIEVREAVLASFALRANSTRDAANWVIRNLS